MGQAKQRGTKEQRVLEAIQRNIKEQQDLAALNLETRRIAQEKKALADAEKLEKEIREGIKDTKPIRSGSAFGKSRTNSFMALTSMDGI
jgi:predicted transposase YdaD